ncbi:MAG: hypothetical protein ACE5G2_06755 [Candidatus Krumholzibacteriia bacterium]
MPTLLAVLAALLLSGCQAAVEKQRPNDPPETSLTSGPPDSTAATSYRVHFFWSGTDPDGVVDHFDWILADHPWPRDDEGRMVSVPGPDDPRWTATFAMDSVFVTRADSLGRDPQPGPGETPGDVLREYFERWHTFFIRAVDERGLPDPTPDYRSFNARTLAPTVALAPPIQPGQIFTGPPTIVFNWSGEDPIDEFDVGTPAASRWVLIDASAGHESLPDSLYHLPERFEWSPWHSWDAEDGSGVRATVRGLSRAGESAGSGFYFFAVQAMDEAGAVTPVFDWQTPGRNNVAVVRVAGAAGPQLILDEPTLGTFTFVGTSSTRQLDAMAGLPVRFSWRADASPYGGEVEAFRYGWNLRNPADDAEWDEDWSPNAGSAPARFLEAGTQRFFVQARDIAGEVTSVELAILAHAPTRSRSLLLVDDTTHQVPEASEEEVLEDERWNDVLDVLAGQAGFEFDPWRDVYDVAENRMQPPPAALVFDYEAIVWNVRSGFHASALHHVAAFPADRGRPPCQRDDSDYLAVFLESGGRMWLTGFRPAHEVWTSVRAPGSETDPVNVTHWMDLHDPQPPEDSLGVRSLLYRLGVEVFDVGAGPGSARPNPGQYCRGLRSNEPQAPELQTGDRWGEPPGQPGRPDVEIYNMPAAMASQVPPLVPPEGLVLVPYTYVSGVAEDPGSGIVSPLPTADGQAVMLLRKRSVADANFTRAISGFEPWLLTLESHRALAEYVLLQHMHVGEDPEEP